MSSFTPKDKRIIVTVEPGLFLRELVHEDASVYFRMLEVNRDYINAYSPIDVPMLDSMHKDVQSVQRSFANRRKNRYTFGIFLCEHENETLIGKMHLVKLRKHKRGTWELGGFTHRDWARRGIGSKVRRALALYALDTFSETAKRRFTDTDDCSRIISQPNRENVAINCALVKAGFVFIRTSKSAGVVWNNYVFDPSRQQN